MMDARKTEQFGECLAVLTELFPEEKDFIASISPRVSRSVTVSTLHGCPPQEIERIASYLITEKHLHTFVKCNPTILGYKTARTVLDSMGYDYIVFDEHHFNEDLQWADAVPMFHRLQALADQNGLEFGLKLSNTFPVDTTRNELPGNEMYMLSFGTVVPLMLVGIYVWIRQKTPHLFLSGFLMFFFSAVGPATGNTDLIFFISMRAANSISVSPSPT